MYSLHTAAITILFSICIGRAQAAPTADELTPDAAITTQQSAIVSIDTAKDLPSAPEPQPLVIAELRAAQSSTPTSGSATSSSTHADPTDDDASTGKPRVTTPEELKAEEHQRIAGVLPAFNVAYDPTAPPLTASQKLSLTMHTNFDYIVIATTALDAGVSELEGDFSGYGWGPPGYFKRWGASYADTFDGNLIGNALLPILLKQDPRYFRMGKGSFRHRLFYVVSTTVICKGDNGKWQPNYSNVLGNFIAGGISNAYYPQADRGLGLTITRALTVTAEGTVGGTLNEFWPDIQRHLFKKHPKIGAGIGVLGQPAGTNPLSQK